MSGEASTGTEALRGKGNKVYHLLLRISILLGFCVLALGLSPTPVAAQCRNWKTNEAGTARAAITVGATAVMVLPANTSSCSAVIFNSSTVDMRCDVLENGAPTSSTGMLVKAGATLGLGMESQKRVDCIRVTTDATADVARSLP